MRRITNMENKSAAQEIREFADRLAQINPEVQEAEHDREYYINVNENCRSVRSSN
jgi:hypothetical protein